jgi:hypothetical protein
MMDLQFAAGGVPKARRGWIRLERPESAVIHLSMQSRMKPVFAPKSRTRMSALQDANAQIKQGPIQSRPVSPIQSSPVSCLLVRPMSRPVSVYPRSRVHPVRSLPKTATSSFRSWMKSIEIRWLCLSTPKKNDAKIQRRMPKFVALITERPVAIRNAPKLIETSPVRRPTERYENG